ncbi:hypothetical protein, partial [Staphylococcus aureus]|uniref:hypothetical protein n=1 Tax=Staphylococcus aureus TaxID=1280 RepID=UPI0039BEBE86
YSIELLMMPGASEELIESMFGPSKALKHFTSTKAITYLCERIFRIFGVNHQFLYVTCLHIHSSIVIEYSSATSKGLDTKREGDMGSSDIMQLMLKPIRCTEKKIE